MGRSLSETAAGAVPANIVTMKTMDDLAIGDIVASGASGKVGFVSSTNNVPNRTVDDVVSSTVVTPLGTTGYMHPEYNRYLSNHILFADGNEFLAYTGNGTTTTTNAGFYSFGTDTKTNVTTGTGLTLSGLEKLNESSFIHLSTTTNNAALQFTIRGKDGTVIKALTSLGTFVIGEGGVSVSSNGVDRIAISYDTASGNYLTILDYSGNVIGTAIQLSTSSGGNYSRVKFLANGNILALYAKAGLTTFTKQFTKEGVAIGAELQISTANSWLLLKASTIRNIQSVGANIYVVANNASTVKIYKISPTNTLISSKVVYTYFALVADILLTAEGNLLVSCVYGSIVYFGLFTQDLALIKSGNFDITISASTGYISSNLFISEVPNGYVVFCQLYDSSFNLRVYFITPTFVSAGVALTIVSSNGSPIASSVIRHKGELYLSGAYSANSYNLCRRVINAGKQSVIGVATSTAAAGGDVGVLVEGEATLNSNYSLIGAFDLRAAVPYGNRGVVVGNKATMFGIKV